MIKLNILITGTSGFIGKNLAAALEEEHNVTAINRQILDLTDRTAVNEFFKDKSFDVVLNCAVAGGSRINEDESKVLWYNLAIFYNLLYNQDKFGKLINFGSGAELDRSDNINLVDSYYKDKYPLDYYGMSKNIIARLIENEAKCFSFRIFNVFGSDELSTRFIKANVQRYINKEPIIIHQDKLMDFFYIDDLITLVKFYINKSYIPEEINAVYKDKYVLSEIAAIINNLSDYKVDVSIEQEGFSKHYIGKSTRLDILPIKWKGLNQGIREIYNTLK
jgi:GDP-L-fucose synthase